MPPEQDWSATKFNMHRKFGAVWLCGVWVSVFLPTLTLQQSTLLKPYLITILFIYCSSRNVVNLSRTSRMHLCFKMHSKRPFKPMGEKPPKPPLFPGYLAPHLIHQYTPKWQLDCSMLFCTTAPQSPHWLVWDFPRPPQNCPFLWGNSQSQLPASYLDPKCIHIQSAILP